VFEPNGAKNQQNLFPLILRTSFFADAKIFKNALVPSNNMALTDFPKTLKSLLMNLFWGNFRGIKFAATLMHPQKLGK